MSNLLKKTGLQLQLAVFITLLSATVVADGFDYSDYASLLKAHVDSDGMVDYAGLKEKKDRLDQVVVKFGKVQPNEYQSWSQNEKIAFLTNAYNAFTLALIVRNYPIDSIKSLNKPWDKREWDLLGKKV